MKLDQTLTWGHLAQFHDHFVGKKIIVHDENGRQVHDGTCDSIADINRDTEKQLFNEGWVVRIKFNSNFSYNISGKINWDGDKLFAMTDHGIRVFELQEDKSKLDEYKSGGPPPNAYSKLVKNTPHAAMEKPKIGPRKGLRPGLELVNLRGRKGVAPALLK